MKIVRNNAGKELVWLTKLESDALVRGVNPYEAKKILPAFAPLARWTQALRIFLGSAA